MNVWRLCSGQPDHRPMRGRVSLTVELKSGLLATNSPSHPTSIAKCNSRSRCKRLKRKAFPNRTESVQCRGSEKSHPSGEKSAASRIWPSGAKVKKACKCWAFVPGISPGAPAPPAVLAEQERFELPVRFISSSRTASEVWQDCRRPQGGPVRDYATQPACLTGISLIKTV
jgi:hypothetical protein